MSRYCGETDAAPILAAATYWRDEALLKDGSVFSEKFLWNLEGLKALDQYFNHNPDEGEGSYWEKLRLQLQPTSPIVKQLAAEMNWLMLLCPSNVRIDSKQQRIKQIWEWSGEPLPLSASTLLNEVVLAGIGSAGSGFNNYRWRELRYCINFCLAFKQLPLPEREFLIADGWRFAQWLQGIPESSSRQLRHMLVFLLFPENFERIFANRDRKAVVQAFSGLNLLEINVMDPVELDKILLRIRGELGEKYSTQELDYYRPPLKGLWGQPDFKATTQDITRKHVLYALAEIDESGIPIAAKSTSYDLLHKARRYPPKLVLSLAAKHASGRELDRAFFSGGESSLAFRLLREFGFEILPKAFIAELLKDFLAQAEAGADLSVASYPKNYRQLDLAVSFGKGNFARIPWIAFLLPGQRPSNGVYPVLLFYRDVKLLILSYGISETHGAIKTWQGLNNVQTVGEFFREKFGREPDRYGESRVAAVFEIPGGLDLAALTQLLDEMIDRYKLLFREVRQPESNYTVYRELYSLDDALRGLFIPREALSSMVDRLRRKKKLSSSRSSRGRKDLPCSTPSICTHG